MSEVTCLNLLAASRLFAHECHSGQNRLTKSFVCHRLEYCECLNLSGTRLLGGIVLWWRRLFAIARRLVAEIKDNGNVHVEFEILSDDTAALQLKVNYDASRLQFKEVVFDTGDTTTNFGNSSYSTVNMGSIIQNGGAIPVNSTMVIVFEPLEAITSAAGLVSIRNTDAASTEGLQQHLNIQ